MSEELNKTTVVVQGGGTSTPATQPQSVSPTGSFSMSHAITPVDELPDAGSLDADAPASLANEQAIALENMLASDQQHGVGNFLARHLRLMGIAGFLLAVMIAAAFYGMYQLASQKTGDTNITITGSTKLKAVTLPEAGDGANYLLTVNGELKVVGLTNLSKLEVTSDVNVGGMLTANSIQAGNFIGNGSQLTNVNALTLEGRSLESILAQVRTLIGTPLTANDLKVLKDKLAAIEKTVAEQDYASTDDFNTLQDQVNDLQAQIDTINTASGDYALLNGDNVFSGVNIFSNDVTFNGVNTYTDNSIFNAGAAFNNGMTVQGNLSGESAVFSTTVEALKFEQNGYDVCDMSGNCTFSGATLEDIVFLQDGNAFGSAGILGTTDNYGLTFITNNQTRLTISQTGAVAVAGDLTANTFSGNGAGLNNLNASNISSGTLGDARLSTNVTLQGNAFNAANQLVQLTATGALPALNGSNLTNVDAATLQGYAASYFTNASNLATGTLSDARLSSNIPLKNANNIFTANNDFTNITATSILQNGSQVCDTSGNCPGYGNTTSSGTTGTIALFTGTTALGDSIISQAATTITVAGTLNAVALQGDGSLVTALNANNISAGTLGVARGGTGANTFTQYGVLYGNGTGALLSTNVGGTNQCLVGVNGGAPAFTNCPSAAAGATPGGAAGGDLGGTYPNPLVTGLNGTALSISTLSGGNLLVFNGTNWVNQSLSGDISVSAGGVATIANGAVSNAKLANSSLTVSAGTGLSGGGSVSLGSSTTLNVVYGNTATSAVAGNTVLNCSAGTGNLTGGGNSITLGAGGTCGSLNVVANPSFTSLTLSNALAVADGGTGATTPFDARTNLGAATRGANSDITSLSGLTTELSASQGGTGVNAGSAANGSLLIGNGSGFTLANLAQGSGISITNGAGSIEIAVDNTICTTAGNCAGAGNGVTTTGGTTGTIALFSNTQEIGDSIISQSGTVISVAGTLSATALQGDGSGLTDLNADNITSGTVAVARISGDYTGITGVGVLTTGSIASGFGSISTTNNISTAAALQGNTLSVGGGTFTVSAAGAISAASGITSSGTITLSSLNSGGVVKANGSGVLSTGTVALGTETTGNYVATLGALSGLTTSGNSGAGSTPTLSVTYGASAATAAEGNTAISFTGAGNLTGTVSGTAGGGITTNTLNVVANPTFSGLVTANGGLTATTVTASGTVTLSALSTGIVQTDASGVVSSATVSRNSSLLSGQTSVANGGTGSTTAAGARTNLGAAASGANSDITSLSAATSVGSTGQALTLQGNASTVLSASDSGFITSVGFSAPTANVSYLFETATAGTYSICTSAGNCSAGGNVSTVGGTAGAIAVFTGTNTLGNSLLSQAASTVTVAGTLAADYLQGSGEDVTNLNGTNITSGTVGVSVGGTGRTSFTSNGIVYGNGSGALQVTAAGATGDCLVAVTGGAPYWASCSAAGSGGTPGGPAGGDLTGSYPNPTVAGLYGTALSINSLTTADILIYDGSNWINAAVSGDLTVNAAGVATIANGAVTNAKLANSAVTVTAGTGLTGGGSISLGAAATLNVAYGGAANTAVEGDTTLVCTAGTGNLSGGGNTITLGNGGTCDPLDVVADPSFNSLTLVTDLSVANGGTGASTAAGARTNLGAAASGANSDITSLSAATSIGSTTQALTLQGNATTTLTATDGGFVTSLGFAAATANVNYVLGTATAGTYQICTSAGNCPAGGNVSTLGGSTGTIALFTGAQAIGDSVLTQTSGNISVGGGLTVTGAATLQGTLSVAGQLTSSVTTGTAPLVVASTTKVANLNVDLLDGFDSTYFAAASGSSNYIQNSAMQQTSANFNIDGSGTIGTNLVVGGTSTFNGNVSVAANQTLTLAGGNTAGRPVSPSAGTMYFDTTTNSLLVFSNNKWQADRAASTKIVAASNSSQAVKDGADYVADGTGDQVEINAALAAAAGGRVYLAEGTYTVNAGISVPNNTTLAGSGNGTLITVPNNFNAAINAISNTTSGGSGTGIVIQDLRLDGNSSNQASGNMIAINVGGSGSGAGSTAIVGAKINSVNVYNWRASAVYIGSNATVVNSTFQGNFNGMSISGLNNTVSNSRFVGNTNDGIYLPGNSGLTITNNTFEGNAIGIESTFSNSNTFNSNTFSGNGKALYLLASHSNTVVGNNFLQNTGYTLEVASSNNNAISNNSFYDNGGSTANNAIVLNNDSNYNSVVGNVIGDSSATGANLAINIQVSTVDGTYLANNSLGGATISNSGTGTVYAGQQNASGDFVYSGGRLGVGTLTPGYQLDVQGGNINTSGDYYSGGTLRLTAAGILQNVTYNGATIGVGFGGTGSATALGARTNLGAAASGANSDITSLSTVTSVSNGAGALAVGNTAQQLTLQGNASSVISATSGGSSTQITFQTPTANVAYRFATAAAGTYDICTNVGNCASVGGGVTTLGGTTNTIAMFTGSQTLGDSLLSQTGGNTVNVAGSLATNGTTRLDASGNLTNIANLNYSGTINTAAISNIVPFEIRGTGVNNNQAAYVRIGSASVYSTATRGLTLTILNRSNYSVVSSQTYNTFVSPADDNLATAIRDVSSSQIGILTSYDSWESNSSSNLLSAFSAKGLFKAQTLYTGGYGTPYAAIFVGASGYSNPTANAVEVVFNSTAAMPTADLSGFLINGSFSATNPVASAIVKADGTGASLYTDFAGNINITNDLTVGGNVNAVTLYQDGNQVCDTSNNCNFAGGSGSGNYIQNTTTPQTANFSITGTGLVGSTLTVNNEIIGQSSNLNQFRAIGGNYGTIFRQDGTNFSLLTTASGNQNGTFNSLRPFSFNNATGQVSLANDTLTVSQANGRVGVGTASATEALDVRGNIYTTGSIMLAGGNTAGRPVSPSEGTIYFDTTTKKLLTFSNGKWQADRSTSTLIVAAGGSNQTAKDSADFVGDGTNDQNAINSAISALPATGGSIVLLDGTYNLSDRINMNKADVTIVGQGTSTALKRMFNSATNAEGLIQLSAQNATLSKFKIDGNKGTYASANNTGIYLVSTSALRVTVSDTTIMNTGGHGIHIPNNSSYNKFANNNISGAAGVGIQSNDHEYYSTYTNNVVYSNTLGGILAGANATVIGNITYSNTGYGITSNSNGTITGNYSYSNGAAGFRVSSYTSVTGNTSQANGVTGIELADTMPSYSTVSGNVISGNTGSGVWLKWASATGNIISNNTITDNAQWGVLNGSTNTTISDNYISNNGGIANYSGIHNQDNGNGAGAKITNNYITDTAGTGNAINLPAGTSNVYLSGNRFSGTGASSIFDAAPNTIYDDQIDGAGNIIFKASAAVGVGTTAPVTSLQNAGTFTVSQLSTPAAATVAVVGTTGSTTWGYRVTAYDGAGETLASTETQIANGNPTLNSSNYNTITPARVGGAVSYKIYRTTAGGTPATTGLIGTLAGGAATFSFNDTGVAISGGITAVPVLNTTGGMQVQSTGNVNFQNAAGTNTYFSANGSSQQVNIISMTAPTNVATTLLSSPASPSVTPVGTAGTTAYTYRVAALMSNGTVGPASATASTATGNAALTAGNRNAVSWTAVTGAIGYNVYRVASSGTPSTLGMIGNTTSTTFNDTGLPVIDRSINVSNLPSTTYYYKVTAVDESGNETAASTEVQRTITATNTQAVSLTWTAVQGARGYFVYRGTSSNGQNQRVATTTNSYVDFSTFGMVTASLPASTSIAYANTISPNGNSQLTIGSNGNTYGQIYVGGSYAPPATATNLGTAGTTQMQYVVLPVGLNGTLYPVSASMAAITQTANATLDGTNYNAISWKAIAGAVSYNVYRIYTGGGLPNSQGLIGNTATTSLNDTGLTASGSVPGTTAVNSLTVDLINTNNQANLRQQISGGYLYTLTNYFLQISDISTPGKPVAVATNSSLFAAGNNSFAVAGKYLYYVSGGTSGSSTILEVYDITVPTNLSLVSTTTLVPAALNTVVGRSTNTVISGRYAYISNGASLQIKIVDISNPVVPSIRGSISALNNPVNVILQNNYMIVSNAGGITVIYNVSNPDSPTLVANPALNVYCNAAYGRYVYCLAGAGNLAIYDMINPASPVLVSTIATGSGYASNTNAITISGRYLYLSGTGNYAFGTTVGAQIYDLSNPVQPNLIGNLVSGAGGSGPATINGRYAYLGTNGNGSGGNFIQTYDLGGIYTQNFEAGAAEIGTLTVNQSASFGGNLAVNGSTQITGSSAITGSASVQGSTMLAGGATVTSLTTASTALTLQANTSQTGDLLQAQGSGGETFSRIDAAGNIIQAMQPIQTLGSLTTSTTGGTLAAGTYYYKVTTIDAYGNESTPSPEFSITTTGSTSTISLAIHGSYTAVPTSYRIYRGTTSGGQNTYFTVAETGTPTFTDTGAAGTAGTPPTVNRTMSNYISANGVSFVGGLANTSYASFAVGARAIASNQNAIALGSTSVASGNNSVAIGGGTASNNGSIAIAGVASGNGAIGIRNFVGDASGNGAIAIGFRAVASGTSSITIQGGQNNIGSSTLTNTVTGAIALGTTGSGTAATYIRGGSGYAGTGTVSTTSGSATVSGASTTFTNDFTVGDRITIGANTYTVTTIASNTSLTIDSNAVATVTGSAFTVVPLIFKVQNTAGTSVLNISDQGNIGIGTSTPFAQLTVAGTVPTASISSTTFGTTAADVVINGRYAYVTDTQTSGFFRIYDMSNPSSPALVGSLGGLYFQEYVTVINQRYVLLTAGNNNLVVVVDVSNPAAPTIATTYSATFNFSWRPVLVGNYLYAGNQSAFNVGVFNVSNPLAISYVTSVNTTNQVTSLATAGRYVYLGENVSTNGFQVLDVSNPAAPVITGSTNLTISPFAMRAIGRYAYSVRGGTGTFEIFDVANSTAPTRVYTGATGVGASRSIAVQGRYAYFIGDAGSVRIMDVSNPAAPTVLGTINTGMTGIGNVSIQGRYLYVVAGTDMKVYDIGGAYIQGLEVSSIESTTLTVSSGANIQGRTSLQGVSVSGNAQFTGGATVMSQNASGVAIALQANPSQTGDLFQVQDSAGYTNGRFDSNGSLVIGLRKPINFTISTSATGGTLAAGTYYYKATAIDAYGNESAPSDESSITTTGTTSTVTFSSFTTTPGAVSYRIYRGTTSNAQNVYFASGSAGYVDTGVAGTAGTPPTTNRGIYSQLSQTAATFLGGTVTNVNAFAVSGTANLNSVAIGSGTQATGISAVAIGTNSIASANSSIAIGGNASGSNSLGILNVGGASSGSNAIAIGYRATASGNGSIALQGGNNMIGVQTLTNAVNGAIAVGTTGSVNAASITRGGASYAGTGTVSTTIGSYVVTGVGTTFTNDFTVGDRITIGSETYTVTGITSNTFLNVSAAYTATNSGVAFTVIPSIFKLQDSTGTAGLLLNDQNNLSVGSTIASSSRLTVTGQQTWTARSANQANLWQSVAFGNGTYVAVSSDGTNRVMTSTDGVTWTNRTAAASNGWKAVTYGNGRFVAVADSGTNRVMFSTDNGATWTSATTVVEANSWKAVTYGNGRFVATSNDGTNRTMYSTDGGVTWTMVLASQNNQWYGLAYGNGVFVATSLGGTNQVMTSPDGITWTNRTTTAETNQWYSVVYSGSQFVAVASSGTNRVMTSADGVTWTGRLAGANAWRSVAYGQGQYVAVANDGTGASMVSADGVNWTTRLAMDANTWNSATYGNGRFIAVASSGTNRIATSSGFSAALRTNGDADVSGILTVSSAATIGGGLSVTGTATIQGATSIANQLSVIASNGVALTVTGAASQNIANFVSNGGSTVASVDSTGRVTGVGLSAGSGTITGSGGFTLTGGTFDQTGGVFNQTADGSTSYGLFDQTLSNTNTSAVLANATAHGISLIGTANSNVGANILTGIDFYSVAAQANNRFTGFNFGTGYTDILRYNNTQLISGAGVIQNVAFSGAVNYSNIQNVTNLTTSGTLTVTGAATFNGTLTATSATFNGTLTVNGHIISGNTSGSTTAAVGSAIACTTPGSVNFTGNDTAGKIVVNSGDISCSGGAGSVVDVTFASTYATAPTVVVTPTSSTAATRAYYVTATTTGFSINHLTGPTELEVFSYTYHVIQ